MSVCETVNCNGGGWNVHIVASDIRRKALEVAERGLYEESAFANIPRQLVQRYFVKVGQHFMVKPRVRNLVRFAPMNLAQPVYLGRFDCIFCMDLLPHFSMAQRVALVQRLHCYLQPGGYLFLGQGEKLPAVGVNFNWQKNGEYLLYQKPMAAAAKSGR
jgi:two-component system CheB/CheR fusion protein